jgi:hypothetical protein
VKRLEEKEIPVVTVAKSDFETDWKRGYAVLEWKPESYRVLRNPVGGREIRIKVDAVPNYCCMKCGFSTVVKEYILKHIFHDEHPWHFGPFRNPYGNIAHVVIDGVDNYDQLVKERTQ